MPLAIVEHREQVDQTVPQGHLDQMVMRDPQDCPGSLAPGDYRGSREREGDQDRLVQLDRQEREGLGASLVVTE